MSTKRKEQTPSKTISAIRIILKSLVLFILINVLYISFRPAMTASVYNTSLFPGRQRLPYSDTPETAYSLNLFSLEAMFASHEVSVDKATDEYRVFILGDSSVWGFLLTNEQTLTNQLNLDNLRTADQKNIQFYNLGYPTISLTKDLMLLEHAMQYQPDLIIWSFTLEAFPPDKQLRSPIAQNNFNAIENLTQQYNLELDLSDKNLIQPNNLGLTLIGQRRNIADVFRLQLYAPLWAATGIDQHIPETYTSHAVDLKPDPTFHGKETLTSEDLSLDILMVGKNIAAKAGIPLMLINEPIFVSSGENNDIRYNAMYPRSVYDQYRDILSNFTAQHKLIYLDAWQSVPNNEFTNTAIHLTSTGSQILVDQIIDFLEIQFACPASPPEILCPIP